MDDICTQVIDELQDNSQENTIADSRNNHRQVGILEIEGEIFPIYTGENLLGRDASCDVTITAKDGSVSKKHAVIIGADRNFFISDLGSLNGTYVNKEKLEPHVRYNVDEKSDLKLGTVYIALKRKLEDDTEETDYDSDTLLTEESTTKQVERPNMNKEEDGTAVDDNIATQFDDTEILDTSVENNTEIVDSSVARNTEILDTSVENNTEIVDSSVARNTEILDTSVENNTEIVDPSGADDEEALTDFEEETGDVSMVSVEHTSILSMETQANTTSKDDTLGLVSAAVSPVSTPQAKVESETRKSVQIVLNMETQADGEGNIMDMETQVPTLLGTVRTPEPKKSVKNILNMDTQAGENILDMETQAATSPGMFQSPEPKKPMRNILTMDTQAGENVLDMETQAASSPDVFHTPGPRKSVRNILTMDTQGDVPQVKENILDMETQAATSPDVFQTPGPRKSVRNILTMDTQGDVPQVKENILDMETQAASSPDKFYTPGIRNLARNILNVDTQAEEPDTGIHELSPDDSMSTKNNILEMDTQDQSPLVNVLTNDMHESNKPGILPSETSSKLQETVQNMIEKDIEGPTRDVADTCHIKLSQDDDKTGTSVKTQDDLENSVKETDVSGVQIPSEEQSFVNSPEKILCPESQDDEAQNGHVEVLSSSFDKTFETATGIVLDTQDSNTSEKEDISFGAEPDSKTCEDETVTNDDSADESVMESSQNEDADNTSSNHFITSSPTKCDEHERYDADGFAVLVGETQEDVKNDNDVSMNSPKIISETQDDDFVENTPPQSPSLINKKSVSESLTSLPSEGESLHLSYRDTQDEVPISQMETQLAPTYKEENSEVCKDKTLPSEKSTVEQDVSVSQMETQLFVMEDPVSISQMETQLAPTYEEENDEVGGDNILPSEEGTVEQNVSVSQMETQLFVMQDPVSISQIDTQITPTDKEENDEVCDDNILPSEEGTVEQDLSVSQMETQLFVMEETEPDKQTLHRIDDDLQTSDASVCSKSKPTSDSTEPIECSAEFDHNHETSISQMETQPFIDIQAGKNIVREIIDETTRIKRANVAKEASGSESSLDANMKETGIDAKMEKRNATGAGDSSIEHNKEFAPTKTMQPELVAVSKPLESSEVIKTKGQLKTPVTKSKFSIASKQTPDSTRKETVDEITKSVTKKMQMNIKSASKSAKNESRSRRSESIKNQQPVKIMTDEEKCPNDSKISDTDTDILNAELPSKKLEQTSVADRQLSDEDAPIDNLGGVGDHRQNGKSNVTANKNEAIAVKMTPQRSRDTVVSQREDSSESPKKTKHSIQIAGRDLDVGQSKPKHGKGKTASQSHSRQEHVTTRTTRLASEQATDRTRRGKAQTKIESDNSSTSNNLPGNEMNKVGKQQGNEKPIRQSRQKFIAQNRSDLNVAPPKTEASSEIMADETSERNVHDVRAKTKPELSQSLDSLPKRKTRMAAMGKKQGDREDLAKCEPVEVESQIDSAATSPKRATRRQALKVSGTDEEVKKGKGKTVPQIDALSQLVAAPQRARGARRNQGREEMKHTVEKSTDDNADTTHEAAKIKKCSERASSVASTRSRRGALKDKEVQEKLVTKTEKEKKVKFRSPVKRGTNDADAPSDKNEGTVEMHGRTMPKRKAKTNHSILSSPDIRGAKVKHHDEDSSKTNLRKRAAANEGTESQKSSVNVPVVDKMIIVKDASGKFRTVESPKTDSKSPKKSRMQENIDVGTRAAKQNRSQVEKKRVVETKAENESVSSEIVTRRTRSTKVTEAQKRKAEEAPPAPAQKHKRSEVFSTPTTSSKHSEVFTTTNSESDSSSPPRRRGRAANRAEFTNMQGLSTSKLSDQMLVCFSGYTDEKLESIITTLGGHISSAIPDNDCVLVVQSLARTLKVLCMLARGLPIVSETWVLESQAAGKFLDPWKFIILDKASEEKYGFELKKCLAARRASKPVFEGWTIMATSNTKPSPVELQAVVQNAGAQFVFRRPKAWPKKSLVVTCEEDKSSWTSIKGPKNSKQNKPKLVKVSAIWETIGHQKIITEGHEFV